jgi:hypothetical protein
VIDIYRAVAAAQNSVPVQKVTRQQRDRAKAFPLTGAGNLIDRLNDMRAGVLKAELVHADAGEVLPVEEEPKHQCQNCERQFGEDELVNPIPDLGQRVAPGEPMPSGECPACGALCQPLIEPAPNAKEAPEGK